MLRMEDLAGSDSLKAEILMRDHMTLTKVSRGLERRLPKLYDDISPALSTLFHFRFPAQHLPRN